MGLSSISRSSYRLEGEGRAEVVALAFGPKAVGAAVTRLGDATHGEGDLVVDQAGAERGGELREAIAAELCFN